MKKGRVLVKINGFIFILNESCGFSCDSRNLFAILETYLRYLLYFCDSKNLFAILKIFLRF